MSSANLNSPTHACNCEHADELLGFLQRRVRCPHEAADLRQEVYLRWWQAGGHPREGKLRAYLYRIARNLLVDGHRLRGAERALFDAEARSEEVASGAPSPHNEVGAAQELALLQSALDELPAHLRDALLWYRMEGLTLREVGLRLGVSESMAGRYVNKALEHCQAKLGSAD